MRINEMFGEYLKAADLNNQRIMVTIESIEMETLDADGKKELKPVLHFVGKNKGLVLNKTNANMIACSFGEETDHWIGQQIGLHVMDVPFGAKIVPAIRVIAPQAGQIVGQAAPLAGSAAQLQPPVNTPPGSLVAGPAPLVGGPLREATVAPAETNTPPPVNDMPEDDIPF